MKSFLGNIALHKAIGIWLGEREISISKVASTPMGLVEIASASATLTDSNMAEVVQQQLAPLLDKRHRTPVAIGLSSSQVFFAARPAASSSGDEMASPEVVLQKALRSPNISIDDLTVDMLRGTVGRSPVLSVAACKKKLMSGVISALDKLGVCPVRAEPAPFALLRLATKKHPAPRRSKTLLRIFLGKSMGMAVLIGDGTPLAWRQFSLPTGQESVAMLSAVRAMETQYRHYGAQASLDYALIHGRDDLHERLRDEEELASKLGTRVIWYDGPSLDGQSMAFGVAQGCLAQKVKTFDLASSLKPQASIREIFPWWDLAFSTMLVILMALALGAHSLQLDDACTSVQAQSSDHKCLASANHRELSKQTKEIEQKVVAVQQFLGTRILWTDYTNDVSIRLPADAMLTMFEGKDDLNTGGRRSRGLRKSFQLRAMVPCSPDGSTPRDIDVFLDALRNHPLLKRDFPSVELADIKRSKPVGMNTPVATFTVVCLPGKGSGGRRGGH